MKQEGSPTTDSRREDPATDLTSISDHELIERTKGGDEDAFGEIVSRYKGRLINFLYRMLGDYEEAVDLTQETFVRVYFAMDRYHTDYAFSTYIYKIASNLGISEIRKRKRRRLMSLTGLFQREGKEDAEFQPPDDAIDPESEVVGAETHQAIMTAILSLPERYRVPIVLREIEERSYEEIANILELGLGTTKSRISRGRGLLRQRLEQYLES